MPKLLPKNKKIAYGMIALFAIVAGVFIWNNYQIEISKRLIKPIRPPAIISGECGIEQCHGLDITCGSNIPEVCDLMYLPGDSCRQFADCQIITGKCQLVKSEKFEECKSCVERCNREDDPIKASRCEGGCGEETNDSDFDYIQRAE